MGKVVEFPTHDHEVVVMVDLFNGGDQMRAECICGWEGPWRPNGCHLATLANDAYFHSADSVRHLVPFTS